MKITRLLFPILLIAPAAMAAIPRFPLAKPPAFLGSPVAQKRDPLTEEESDQIRELAQEPDKRIRLMLKFIQARLATIDQIEGDARMAAGRGKQVHDLLEDFTALIDELDDNIDDYVDKKADIRKSLKDAVESDTAFQLKLRTLKDQKASSKEFADYNFVLQNAADAVNASLDNSRQALEELETALKQEKEEKKKK